MSLCQTLASELITDLYEFTMAESYLREGLLGEATFSLFIRKQPRSRPWFVSAGLESLLETIARLRFREESIAYLRSLGMFSESFLDYLKAFRFTGTIRAIPEGRLCFAQEPLLEVTAPIVQGQLLETLIINAMQLDILVASKAARCVQAARGRGLIEFGLRRTHGVDAGLKAARSSYLTGFLGTSNVLAGQCYGIPVFGTMAHSYITGFPSEIEAFQAFASAFPDRTVLLIDTYDTIRGAEKAVEIARHLASLGKRLIGVRLDSGDLVSLSREVRRILNGAGYPEVKILVSGSLDEYSIRELIGLGAEIDIFAVGTKLGVSADMPYLDIAYKLVEYQGHPVLKLSSGKKTWVGQKQVYRAYDDEGRMSKDTLGLSTEEYPEAEPLLDVVVRGGERVRPMETLESIRSRFRQEWSTLPERYQDLDGLEPYPVEISLPLQRLEEKTVEQVSRREGLSL